MRYFYVIKWHDIFEYELLKETPQYFFPAGSGKSLFGNTSGFNLRVRKEAANVCGTLEEAVARFEELEQSYVESAEAGIARSHKMIMKARGLLAKEKT